MFLLLIFFVFLQICGGTTEALPQQREEGRRPPGALVQELAHSGSSERLQAAGRLLVEQKEEYMNEPVCLSQIYHTHR